jgi:hypothetical protein
VGLAPDLTDLTCSCYNWTEPAGINPAIDIHEYKTLAAMFYPSTDMDSAFTRPTVLTPTTKVHGRKSDCKFTPPPLDASLTIPEIYDFHYRVNPDHHVFVYPHAHGGLKYLNYSHVIPAADRAARFIANTTNRDFNSDVSASSPIAILATSGAFRHINELFCVPCLISSQTRSPPSPLRSDCFSQA